MSDSTTKPEDNRRNGVMAAMYVAILCVIAVAGSLHLAFSGSGFDLVRDDFAHGVGRRWIRRRVSLRGHCRSRRLPHREGSRR